MNFPLLLLLVALVTGLPAATASACDAGDATARKWLDRMSRSLHEVSYRGVFTYQHGGAMQTLRISHSVRGDVESERLTNLTGAGGSIVRAAHPLDCIHPGNRLLRIGAGFESAGDDCGLARYYRLQLGEENMIAGRRVQILQVLPRDMYRYGYQMALDTETGLLLGSQTIAHDGKVLERFQFADLEIGAVDEEGTQVEVLHRPAHPAPASAEADARIAEDNAWLVNWVPQGFTLTEGNAASAQEKTYTDGLTGFSVFLERLDTQIAPGAGRARRGGTTAYTRGMQLAGQPILVTVVGEVPVNTARMVADSVGWMVAASAN